MAETKDLGNNRICVHIFFHTHAQLSSGARDLNFCLSFYLRPRLCVPAAKAALICDKYQTNEPSRHVQNWSI